MRSSRMCFLAVSIFALAVQLATSARGEDELASSEPTARVADQAVRAQAEVARGDQEAAQGEVAAVPGLEAPKGSLVIIGGALRFGEKEVWERVVELAGGQGAKIAVFPTASGNPIRSGNRIMNALRAAGGYPFLVPVAVQKIDVDYRQAVNDPLLIAQVREAGGVFFTGGEQSRIVQALYTEDGKNTPLLDAVWDVYHKGGVVAGTSAGAAVMSRIMFRDARNVLDTLTQGVTMGKEISHGLGFLDPLWFVEQHSLARGRFARALAAMQSQGLKYGIGVEENTALVITAGSQVKVIGHRGAVVMDLSQASVDPNVKAFNLKNCRLTYLDRGDTFNMTTLVITPGPEKNDSKIDPNAADFRPDFDDRLVANDILGNNTVCDLINRLMINKTPDAIGLAFDGAAALHEPTPGFEFHFYRDKDTVGWRTEAFGGEDFTVANVHLDIRPVEIAGPLYK
jgi:cyanophycinase